MNFISDNSTKLKIKLHFCLQKSLLRVFFCRAKPARRPRSTWTYVSILLARQFAMARSEGGHVERTLPEDWRYQACDAHRSPVQRSGRSVSVYMLRFHLLK